MKLLTISDIAEESGLPKPTIYRMFHELADLIPHKRIGRKILFPEEAVSKVVEFRSLTKDEGFTYQMIRERIQESVTDSESAEIANEAETEGEAVSIRVAQPDTSQGLSHNISASFDGLREDLRLLAAQIDRQNDLLSRIIGREQAQEELPEALLADEVAEEWISGNGADATIDLHSKDSAGAKDQNSNGFLLRLSNFWAGKGWKA